MSIIIFIIVNLTLMAASRADEYTQFLKDISKIESSSGKNLNHRYLTKGIHKGQHAIGEFGLMPNTIIDVVTKSDKITFNTFENIANIQVRAELIIKDPEGLDFVLKSLYKRIKRNQNNNLERMVYAWEAGHYLKSSDISQFALDVSPRIKRYRNMKRKSNGYNLKMASTSNRH